MLRAPASFGFRMARKNPLLPGVTTGRTSRVVMLNGVKHLVVGEAL
jgi:hypothetical protein